MSEEQRKMQLALISNLRLIALMLDRANDLKEIEISMKFPEHQDSVLDQGYEDLKSRMLKSTQDFTIYNYMKPREEEKKDGGSKQV